MTARRRDVLRSAAGAGAGAVGAAALASPAAARHRRSTRPDSGPIGYRSRWRASRDARRNGLSGSDVRRLEDGTYAVLTTDHRMIRRYADRRDHPSIGGYTYLGTFAVDRICKWTIQGCAPIILYGLIGSPEPASKVVVNACAAVGVGCTINSTAREYVGCSFTEVHVYRPAWWNIAAHVNGHRLMAVPHGGCA